MTLAAHAHSGSQSAPASPGARMLDELAAGKSIDQIADARNCTRAHVEKFLRAELRAISIRPIRDYAKIQIHRLETVVGKLTEKAGGGDLAAVDRLLRTFDRLDRYHGFSMRAAPAPEYEEITEERLLAKFERAARNTAAARQRA